MHCSPFFISFFGLSYKVHIDLSKPFLYIHLIYLHLPHSRPLGHPELLALADHGDGGDAEVLGRRLTEDVEGVEKSCCSFLVNFENLTAWFSQYVLHFC